MSWLLLVVCCSLVVACCLLPFARVCMSLFVAQSLLFVVRCSLFVVRLVFDVFSSLDIVNCCLLGWLLFVVWLIWLICCLSVWPCLPFCLLVVCCKSLCFVVGCRSLFVVRCLLFVGCWALVA